jgi:hypothetical protein
MMEGCIGFGFAAIAFSAGVSTGVRVYYDRAYGLIWCLGRQTQLAARSFVRSFVYRKVYSISSPEQYSPTRTTPFKIRSMIFPEQKIKHWWNSRIQLGITAGLFQEEGLLDLLTSACISSFAGRL